MEEPLLVVSVVISMLLVSVRCVLDNIVLLTTGDTTVPASEADIVVVGNVLVSVLLAPAFMMDAIAPSTRMLVVDEDVVFARVCMAASHVFDRSMLDKEP